MSVDVKEFRKALTSDPVNENYIADTLSSLSASERLEFRKNYKVTYGHPIQDDIKDALSFKFKDLCFSLLDSPAEFDAREMHKALHSFMNDDKAICEIFATRTKDELELIDKAYQKFYGISLKDDIKNETKKEYATFLNELMDTPRPERKKVQENFGEEMAKQIVGDKIKDLTKDKELFKKFFVETSREDLINISRAYNDLEGKDLYTAIKEDTSGKNRKLIKNIMFSLISPSEYYARKIKRAIEGLGTDTASLNRAIISRSEIDIDKVAEIYLAKFGSSLKKDVFEDSSGPYQKMLVNLINKKPSQVKH